MEFVREKEESHEAFSPVGGTGPTLVTPPRGVGPSGASEHRNFAYLYPPDAKTLKGSIIFHEKFRHAAAFETKFRGSEAPVPAPCWDGD